MVHLIVHLAHEAKVGGLVQYRWMYPIERFLLTLKSFVRNKAHLEGSIAESFLTNECLTFCSQYLSKVETRFSRPTRNDDEFDTLDDEYFLPSYGEATRTKEATKVSIKERKESE